MFGLESNSKKKSSNEFLFDLEKDLKDPVKRKGVKAKIEQRLQDVKGALRSGGENQEEYDRFGLLLHGYNSILKVISRFESKLK